MCRKMYKDIFGKILSSTLSLFVPSFSFFSTFNKYTVAILVINFHRNMAQTSYNHDALEKMFTRDDAL